MTVEHRSGGTFEFLCLFHGDEILKKKKKIGN